MIHSTTRFFRSVPCVLYVLLIPFVPLFQPRAANCAAPKTDLRFWLENMIWHHSYSPAEASEGLGLPEADIRAKMREWKITPETAPPRDPAAPIKVLPWAPGRHPRIGFLEGAVNPQRDTKLSIFLPWENAGYVVFDLPEAVFSNLGLLYLPHTHIPTIWEKEGITLEAIDWTRNADGTLESRRTLPNKITFGVKVWPRHNAVDYEYWLENGTSETLTGLRNQLCVLLKNAPDFNDQSESNKLLLDHAAAVHSRDGKRWIITACERSKTWQNAKCPCMHADPTFDDCAPGKRVWVRGSIWFYEGEDVKGEISRREASGTLFGN